MPEESAVIQQLPVDRDEMGFGTHPGWPRDGDEDAIPKTWFAEQRPEALCIEMESDGPVGLFETWADEGLCDCTAPHGRRAIHLEKAGSSSRHDTEDGPICVWVRQVKPGSPSPGSPTCTATRDRGKK